MYGPAEYRANVSLYRAIITQALLDIKSNSKKGDTAKLKREAELWILSKDFETVCDYADLNPQYVRYRIAIAAYNNFEWRLPAGKGWRTAKRKLKESSNNAN